MRTYTGEILLVRSDVVPQYRAHVARARRRGCACTDPPTSSVMHAFTWLDVGCHGRVGGCVCVCAYCIGTCRGWGLRGQSSFLAEDTVRVASSGSMCGECWHFWTFIRMCVGEHETCVHVLYVRASVCMYVCTYVCMYVYTYVLHIYVHIRTQIYTHAFLCVQVHENPVISSSEPCRWVLYQAVYVQVEPFAASDRTKAAAFDKRTFAISTQFVL